VEEELLCEKKAIEEELEAIPKRIKPIAVAGIAFLLAHKPLIGLADSVLSGVIWLVIFFCCGFGRYGMDEHNSCIGCNRRVCIVVCVRTDDSF